MTDVVGWTLAMTGSAMRIVLHARRDRRRGRMLNIRSAVGEKK
ncbi:hypothetical protein [Ralstonia solanacearum]|nr:hypothetical protein [Ralstonia solanacearum]